MVHRADRLMDVLFEMRKVNIEPKKVVFIYSKVGKIGTNDSCRRSKRWKSRFRNHAPRFIFIMKMVIIVKK
ncbi:O-methyltransferase [Staphylococcus aureus]|uniref:O-methyltransferase n=1 Tax=Staphylococcus aureus TaxID=1280 RepID=A0A380DL92_STAAU|nr:O-methyltransferase [Staphylococcus aureus]